MTSMPRPGARVMLVNSGWVVLAALRLRVTTFWPPISVSDWAEIALGMAVHPIMMVMAAKLTSGFILESIRGKEFRFGAREIVFRRRNDCTRGMGRGTRDVRDKGTRDQ